MRFTVYSSMFFLVTISENCKTNPMIIGTIMILMSIAQLIALFAIETFSPHNPIPTVGFKSKNIVFRLYCFCGQGLTCFVYFLDRHEAHGII